MDRMAEKQVGVAQGSYFGLAAMVEGTGMHAAAGRSNPADLRVPRLTGYACAARGSLSGMRDEDALFRASMARRTSC